MKPSKLSRLQDAAKFRHGKEPGFDKGPLKVRQRLAMFLLLDAGVSPQLVADRINSVFGTQWSKESVERWRNLGCPLQ